MAELVFFRRGEEVLRFAFDVNRIVVGRGDKCDVVIPDPEVSRQQLAMQMIDGECVVDDLSGKGSLVAGQKFQTGKIPDGADITLGQWRAIFRKRNSAEDSATTEVGQHTELLHGGEAKEKAVRPSVQLRLRVQGKETIQKLNNDTFTVGKDSSNDLVLNQRFVSGRHLKVSRVDEHFHVVDQQSTNGTWIGPVRVYDADVPLYTSFRVGETELTIEPLSNANRGVASYHGIMGNHPSMRQMTDLIERVGPSSAAVAIFGESGAGKELVARAIHEVSSRAGSAFIPINCAAISRELIESELFGHEKGSFTGAQNTHKGAFEEANGGTLFLDEIGELPLDMQAKLLRALESGEIKRVGASRPMQVDVRIVAATNRDLLQMARSGRFREDLYYRLCVVPIQLPPLRNRSTDVAPLTEHFLKVFSPRGQNVRISPAAVEALKNHSWPGNVRELKNVVHRALLLRKGQSIEASDLSFDSAPTDASTVDILSAPDGFSLTQLLDTAEKQIVMAALDRYEGNREKAIKHLSVSRSTFYKKLREWGLEEGTAASEKHP